MRDKRVLVVGDVMLDEFVWGRVSRISPEAPVPVVAGRPARASTWAARATWRPTCARSAAPPRSSASWAATRRARACARRSPRRASAARLVDAGASRRTTLKTRIVAHGQQVVRADQEDTGDAADARSSARSSPPCARSCRRLRRSSSPTTRRASSRPGCCGALLPLARRKRACRCWWTPSRATSASTAERRVVTPNQLEAEQVTGLRLVGAGASSQRPGAASWRGSAAGPCSSRAASTA